MADPWKRCEVIGDCTVYLGDCLEIMGTLGKVDCVVTDPPYGMAFRSIATTKMPGNSNGWSWGRGIMTECLSTSQVLHQQQISASEKSGPRLRQRMATRCSLSSTIF